MKVDPARTVKENRLAASRLKKYLKGAEIGFRDSWGTDISTPAARRRAWWDFQLMDHSFLRRWWTNFDKVADGVYRANQPAPHRIATYAAMGIKTIINLRGVGRHSHYLFEREACAAHGIRLADRRLFAGKLPLPGELLELYAEFLTAEKPFLLHCKSGADRAGLAAALYLMLIEDVPVEVAHKQLHWRYLHFRDSRTGILDYFLDRYAEDHAKTGIGLLDWITRVYDRDAMTAAYHARKR